MTENTKALLKMFGWVAVFILIVAGVTWLASRGNQTVGLGAGTLSDPVTDSDWSRGGKDAKAVLVEYSDFQCPACASFYPILQRLSSEYGDKLRFVYRFFPLKNIHPNAVLSAQAAQAAGLQDKFWEMHDILFEKQSDWAGLSDPHATFAEYAKTLKLDTAKFLSDLDSAPVKAKVQDSYSSGERSSVHATPTLYLNGKELQNTRGYGDLKSNIDRVLSGS